MSPVPLLQEISDLVRNEAAEGGGFSPSGAPPWGGATWLNRLRQAAFQRISDHGFPTSKDESWKYIRIAPILNVPFKRTPPGINHCLSRDAVDQLAGNFGEIELVFVNGQFAPGLSSLAELPTGVQVMSLAAAFVEACEEIEPILSRPFREPPHPHAFTALNTALAEDGAFIKIPANTVIEKPIVLVFLSDSPTAFSPVMSHPKVLVITGTGSRATIVEVHTGILDHLYFTNVVTDMILNEGAEIAHYKIQNETDKAFHIALLNVRQGRGSRFSSHVVALGAALSRHEVDVALLAPDAQVILDGLYLPRNGQHLDNPTRIDHVAPHCTSRQLYKGVIGEKGRGGFYGQVIVRPGAMKTDASQVNKNLLLSESAQVDTRPRLEIFADDVKCAHGAAVGQLDEEAIFYLRSRGTSVQAARGLLTYAFANEMLERIPLIPLRSHIKQLLASRFSTNDVDSV